MKANTRGLNQTLSSLRVGKKERERNIQGFRSKELIFLEVLGRIGHYYKPIIGYVWSPMSIKMKGNETTWECNSTDTFPLDYCLVLLKDMALAFEILQPNKSGTCKSWKHLWKRDKRLTWDYGKRRRWRILVHQCLSLVPCV